MNLPMLPKGFSWRGTALVVEVETGDGTPIVVTVALVADADLFAKCVDDLLTLAVAHGQAVPANLNTAKYEAVPILEYLQSLNRSNPSKQD